MGLTHTSARDMAGWKTSFVALVVLADLANAQRSQSSPPIFSANSLENGAPPPAQSFTTLLSRLTSESSDRPRNSILTSLNSPSVSLGSIGSSLGKQSNSGSRTSISSSAIPLFSSVPLGTVQTDFDNPRESSFIPSEPVLNNQDEEQNVFLELEFPQTEKIQDIVPEEKS